ncbi:MAG: hypothetical protein IPJ88_16930 [Myxococcales bacterium]|nr:MAG: hypothetical protein IPJ88_16930 [Myxococcales bacterium]
MRRLAYCIVTLLASSSVTAESGPSIELLRKSLEHEFSGNSKVSESSLHSVGYTLDVAERIKHSHPAQSGAWIKRAAALLKACSREKIPILS